MRPIEIFVQDLRYSLRMLKKSPGFAATAILTLALGIGAMTAIFSVVDAVMLERLPFPTAERLVRIKSVLAASGNGNGIASYPDFLDWRARNHAFEGVAVFDMRDFTFIGPGEPVHLHGAVVSADLFSLLGAQPEFGRTFRPEEDQEGADNGADGIILSHGAWQREFGADSSVLGRIIRLDDKPYTVVGVMPARFQFPIGGEPAELWTTIAMDTRGGAGAMSAQRGAHYLNVIGVLRDGVTRELAQAEMVTIASALNHEHPENKARTVRLVPEIEMLAGPMRAPLLVLLGAVGCLLLIVCANVANLLLVRGAGRHGEIAVRAALGASRIRAVSQLLSESTTLALCGGGLGLVLALIAVRALEGWAPGGVPRLEGIGLEPRLLCFVFVLSLAVGILFGVAPALRVSRIDLSESLKEIGRRPGNEHKDQSRMRDTLVVSEIALAGLLLPCAVLLVQSFVRITRVDPGFDPNGVLTFQVDRPARLENSQIPAFYRDVVARLAALPGVKSASAAASLPLTGDNIVSSIEIEGQPTPIGSRPAADFNVVEPNYFHTLGIALVAGRDFTARDDLHSTPVVIINRALAHRFFGSEDPIGRHVRPGVGNGSSPRGEPPMREIVGVIGDVKQGRLEEDAAPEVYAPAAQMLFGSMFVVIRTEMAPSSIVEPARRSVAAVNKSVPIYHVKSLDAYFAQAAALPRFVALLVSSFAALAVALACLGVYGVVSFVVARRTHEIGIRMALGAGRGEIRRWVLARAVLLALLGVSIGVTTSFGMGHVLARLLYGVSSTDPATFVLSPLALVAAATLASYLPARRAMRVDPMVALRHE